MPEQDKKTGRFITGNNGGGRPKGSRNRLSEDFLRALHEDFQENGAVAIRRVRVERPQDYIKVIAGLLPKEMDLNINRYDDISDNQLRQEFIHAVTEARTLGIDIGVGSVAGEDQEGEGNAPAATVPGHGTA